MLESLGKLKSTKIEHINQSKMKSLFVIGICLLSTNLVAQTEIVKKSTSYLMPQIALLNGSSGVGSQAQLAGGLVKNNWNFGLGTGIDYYELRSVPLYADVRYHFGKAKKAFVYANIGYNFAWAQNIDDRVYIVPPVMNTLKQSGGLYADFGIGYDIRFGKNHSLALSTGYSVKQLHEEYEESTFWIWPRPTQTDPTIRKFDYVFKRLSLKVAYSLW